MQLFTKSGVQMKAELTPMGEINIKAGMEGKKKALDESHRLKTVNTTTTADEYPTLCLSLVFQLNKLLHVRCYF